MIIRRPVMTRRPMLQSAASHINQVTLPFHRPLFVERKKAVLYKVPTSIAPILRVAQTLEKQALTGNNMLFAKTMKTETSPRTKLEAKVSEAAPMDISDNLMGPIKPARNTGFNPDSIVIEGGFKPIIRNIEKHQNTVQKRVSEGTQHDETAENIDYRVIDNFEPVFVPSPPVADKMKKQRKKLGLNGFRSKVRLEDADDMEMAADRLEAYYLPPATTARTELPSGILVTYDGKTVKDSNLARSLSRLEDRSRIRLNSDILKTPQYGRYRGDLPPPVPGNLRSESPIQFEKRKSLSTEFSFPEVPSKSQRNTKLTLLRSKRSAHKDDRDIPSTEFERGNSTSEAGHHDDDHGTLLSAGQIILANMKYIVLTIILYFVI